MKEIFVKKVFCLLLFLLSQTGCKIISNNITPTRVGVPDASRLFEPDQNFIGDLTKDGYEIRFFTQGSGDKYSLGLDFRYIYIDENSEEETRYFRILENEKFPEDMTPEDAFYLYNLLYPNQNLSMFFNGVEDESNISEVDNPSYKVQVIEDNENTVIEDNFGIEVKKSETQQIFVLISELNLFPVENFPYTTSAILEQSSTRLLRIGRDGIVDDYYLDNITSDSDIFPYTRREPFMIDLSQDYPSLDINANAVLVYFEEDTRIVVVGSIQDINTALGYLGNLDEGNFTYSPEISATLQQRLSSLQFLR